MTLSNPVVSSVIKNYSDSQNAFLAKEVVIPLAQEHGIDYEPIVKVGDIVKEGDVIATATSKDQTVIHSSIPGEVLDIVPCYTPDSKQCFAIKIKFKGALSYLGKKSKEESASTILVTSIAKRLIENGVVNTFKTAFPESLGLQIKKIEKGSNLIVRMFDEDPYRVTDSLVSKLYFNEVLKGAEIVAKAIGADGIVFAVDQKLDSNQKENYANIQIPNFRCLEMNIKRYPCGTPREIISAFSKTGLKKKSNFALSKKDLFIDSSTAYEVYKSVGCSIPSIDKLVHFYGNSLYSSALLNVKIGMQIKDVIEQLGGFVKEPALIIINGHVSGTSITSLEVPITKYVKSIEFLSSQKISDDQVYKCINCGNCRVACPVNISPDILHNNSVNYKLLPETYAASALGCIECGLCNTVCPARLPLSQTITLLKSKLME